MKSNRDQTLRLGVVLLSSLLCGCQGGLQSLPALNGLATPSRVPPPPMGSFVPPSSYLNSSSGTTATNSAAAMKLSDLRTLESGSQAVALSKDAVGSTKVTHGSFTTEPPSSNSISVASAIVPVPNSSIPAPASNTLSDAQATWKRP